MYWNEGTCDTALFKKMGLTLTWDVLKLCMWSHKYCESATININMRCIEMYQSFMFLGTLYD